MRRVLQLSLNVNTGVNENKFFCTAAPNCPPPHFYPCGVGSARAARALPPRPRHVMISQKGRLAPTESFEREREVSDREVSDKEVSEWEQP